MSNEQASRALNIWWIELVICAVVLVVGVVTTSRSVVWGSVLGAIYFTINFAFRHMKARHVE